MSDYDFCPASLSLIPCVTTNKLDAVEYKYYTDPDGQTPVQFINDDIKKLNKDLSEGRYIYTQVKKKAFYYSTAENSNLPDVGN